MRFAAFASVLALVTAVSAACNHNGGSSHGGSNVGQIAATVSYPPARSLTDADSIPVRGTVSGQDRIASVSVNGVAATSVDDFATFSVIVPLAVGVNTLTVQATDVQGRTNAAAASVVVVREGPSFTEPVDLALEDPQHVLVLDAARLALIRVDLVTGARTLVTGDPKGAGPQLFDPRAVAVDSATNRAYVADSARLLAVDLATGDRTLLADDAGTGTGPNLGQLSDVLVMPGALLVTSLSSNALLQVDVATGDRAVLSDPTTGSGPVWSVPEGLGSSPSGIFVVDSFLDALFSVDPGSGDRAIVSDDASATGPSLAGPVRVRFDLLGNDLLVTCNASAALIAVDPLTGNRATVSDPTVGSGPTFTDPLGLVVLGDRALLVDRGGRRALFSIDLATGNRTTIGEALIGAGPPFVLPIDVELDRQHERLLVLDPVQDTLMAVSLSGGDRSIVSENLTHTATPLHANAMALDEDRDRVLVPVGNELLAVSLVNGSRSTISGPSIGTGPLFVDIADLCLDSTNFFLFLTNRSPAQVFVIDLRTGEREVLSDATTGSGPMFGGNLSGIACDESGGRLLVLDPVPGQLFSVDSLTGARTVLADSNGAPSLVGADAIELDEPNDVAWITTQDRILQVDANSGAVIVRSQDDAGSGPWLELATGLRFDDEKGVLWAVSPAPVAAFAIDLNSGERTIASR